VQRDYNAKRAMAIGLTGTDNINGRKYFKLRDLSTEPTQMREVTYTSMLHACGVVSPNQVHVRLYVNAVPYGLFALTDYVLMKAGIPGSTREV
jgi:CotH protein